MASPVAMLWLVTAHWRLPPIGGQVVTSWARPKKDDAHLLAVDALREFQAVIAAHIEDVDIILGEESLSTHQRLRNEITKRTLERQKDERGDGNKKAQRTRGRKGHHETEWETAPHKEMCRDDGRTDVDVGRHDCCASGRNGEPAACEDGYDPSRQPDEYSACPNFACCAIGDADCMVKYGAAKRTLAPPVLLSAVALLVLLWL